MASLYSYRTADSSKKITTYVYHNKYFNFAFDFGSIDIPINDIKEIDYIFIGHEHMDHFLGLLNMDYAEALLKNKCEIYASNVTKDLLIALFENVYRVDLDKKEIRTIRELLNSIKGVLFFEKYNLNKHAYFRIFPSGHTFGSAMIYLHDEEHNQQHDNRNKEHDDFYDIQPFSHGFNRCFGLRFHIIKDVVNSERHVVLGEIVQMTIKSFSCSLK